MSSIPGARFNISGTSGAQALLAPKDSWRCYVLPRGAYASQASSGTSINFDSNAVASRFAANNWIQVGLDPSKIVKVTVPVASHIVVNQAVVVSKNDRILLIGNTQPSVSGGSATYITPNTLVRQRDDDAADLYTNSMITSDSNGLVQFFGGPALFDCILQDANQTNQVLIADLPVGAVEGISTSLVSVFGATATFNAAVGITGTLTVGATATFNAAAGFTGPVVFGATATFNANAGFTGNAVFGKTITLSGTSGNYSQSGAVTFGNTVTITGALGVTSTGAFGSTLYVPSYLLGGRISFNQTNGPIVKLSSGWGASSSVSIINEARDSCFQFLITCAGSGQTDNPTVSCAFTGGTWTEPMVYTSRITLSTLGGRSQPTVPFMWQSPAGSTTVTLLWPGLPVAGETYGCGVFVVGSTGV